MTRRAGGKYHGRPAGGSLPPGFHPPGWATGTIETNFAEQDVLNDALNEPDGGLYVRLQRQLLQRDTRVDSPVELLSRRSSALRDHVDGGLFSSSIRRSGSPSTKSRIFSAAI